MATPPAAVSAPPNPYGNQSNSIRTVILQVSPAGHIRPLLLVRRALQDTGQVRIGTMAPTVDTVMMDIELVTMFDVPSFLQQLPWVAHVSSSRVDRHDAILCNVTLRDDHRAIL